MTIVGNVGDDVEVLGLHVSPDLDSILYALAGLADEERGWGRAGRDAGTRSTTVAALGGEAWFRLGDRDLGLHLVRTQALARGRAALGGDGAARARGSGSSRALLPATDDRAAHVARRRRPGTFPFQEWFVARGHRDEVDAVRVRGAEAARPAPGVARGARRRRR